MQPESNHSPSPDGAASLLVAALEHTWQTIRTHHPDVPDAVLVVASGAEGKRLNLGHFAPHRWQVNGSDRHEVLVGAKASSAAPWRCSGRCCTRPPTASPKPGASRTPAAKGGTTTAATPSSPESSAWRSPPSKPIGWSATTVPEPTAAGYAGHLEELQAALVLWRRQEHRIGPGPRSRNLLAATCACGRRIRAAKATLAEAPIVCGACEHPFESADSDEDSN
jgi:hypothetical protein